MTPTAKTPIAMTPDAGPATPLPAAGGPSESSLTSAYLNQFNEVVKLIEQLPETPELIDDLLNWHPTTYQDFFNASAMPGRVTAADVYASLNRCVRQNFEGVVDDLDRKALGAVAVATGPMMLAPLPGRGNFRSAAKRFPEPVAYGRCPPKTALLARRRGLA